LFFRIFSGALDSSFCLAESERRFSQSTSGRDHALHRLRDRRTGFWSPYSSAPWSGRSSAECQALSGAATPIPRSSRRTPPERRDRSRWALRKNSGPLPERSRASSRLSRKAAPHSTVCQATPQWRGAPSPLVKNDKGRFARSWRPETLGYADRQWLGRS